MRDRWMIRDPRAEFVFRREAPNGSAADLLAALAALPRWMESAPSRRVLGAICDSLGGARNVAQRIRMALERGELFVERRAGTQRIVEIPLLEPTRLELPALEDEEPTPPPLPPPPSEEERLPLEQAEAMKRAARLRAPFCERCAA
jgi:hypothetical protein